MGGEGLTAASALTVHHQHCVHVCLRAPVLRPDLAGAAHPGPSAGQCPALLRLASLASRAGSSLQELPVPVDLGIAVHFHSAIYVICIHFEKPGNAHSQT